MSHQQSTFFKEIQTVCQELGAEFDLIPKARQEKLIVLSKYISQKYADKQVPKLIVICTHNSRRSHLGQIWLAVAAAYFQLPEIHTFSGGTEATAFNIRAVKALQKIGFKITAEGNPNNPKYQVSWKEGMKEYPAFSKKYDDAPNPQEAFAAIMVCTQADEGCPIVSGCDFRLALPYDDPKNFDDTDLEEAKYDERVRQIGREILFSMNQVQKNYKNA